MTMKNILFLLFISISQVLLSQTPAWYSIPNAPDNNIKLDDIFFINPVTGWLASGQGQPNIFKTTNGGLNWSSLPHSSLNYRSIGFADSVRGWAGVLDTNIIFRTLN